MPTSEEKHFAAKIQGKGTAVLMLVLLILACAGLSLFIPSWTKEGLSTWPFAALVGFFLSGAMGLWSLWTTRRAMRRKGQSAFMNAVFGNMLLRLIVTGLLVGLILGFGWLHSFGFVGGMFGGFIVFQVIEISAVATTARTEASPVEGATDHAR